jgi:hypothetical protein
MTVASVMELPSAETIATPSPKKFDRFTSKFREKRWKLRKNL